MAGTRWSRNLRVDSGLQQIMSGGGLPGVSLLLRGLQTYPATFQKHGLIKKSALVGKNYIHLSTHDTFLFTIDF